MKKNILLLLICVVGFTSMYSQTAMFGVNASHTGVYDANPAAKMKLTKTWEFKTNGMIFSSAAVVNNVIYFGSDDNCLYALTVDGKLKWKYQTNKKIRSTPAVKDTVVYFSNYDGIVFALNTKNGSEIWHFQTDGESHFAAKGLFGFSPSDKYLIDPWDFYASSPVISDSLLYIGSGRNVYAINLKNGQQIWKFKAEDIVHSTPAVAYGMVYFGCWDGTFYSLDSATGALKWNNPTGTDPSHLMQGIQASPTVVDSMVIIGARDAKVYAFDAFTGQKKWTANFNSSWMPSSFAYYNKTLYTGSSEATGLTAMDVTSGTVKFSISQGFYFTFSSPVIASQTAFVGCMNGSLFAVDINTGIIKSRFDTNGRRNNPIKAVLDDGNLNPDVFKMQNTYEDGVEYTRRVFTAGSILASPSISKNIVYFGSTDNYFYALKY